MTAGLQRRNEHFRLAAQADDVLLDAGEDFGRDQCAGRQVNLPSVRGR